MRIFKCIALFLTIMVMVFGFAVAIEYVMQEPSTIRTAAERNGISYQSDDWYILLAINKAEGNPEGREFGIMNPAANTLDKQAGWAAASIVKSRARWVKAGKPEDFITFMGRRYCPPLDHELNINWVPNVTYWAGEFKRIDKGE
jgi:hypothetical protein